MAAEYARIPALPVNQWLKSWDSVDFDPREHRRKPEPRFYVASMDALLLRRLSGIYRRGEGAANRSSEDLGIQRRHDPERSAEIGRFVEFGYPWSELPERRRRLAEYSELRKPGWIPTAVVINVLTNEDRRLGKKVSQADRVLVETEGTQTWINVPTASLLGTWKPGDLPPIEVIDGQHRLWAFSDPGKKATFEIPVVVFHGLDLSWQAYLFYTINIKPKKINRSLAFDLYPLLRTQDWLEGFEGPAVYRETRAQELTEVLASHPSSPWKSHINMLGEGRTGVTQAAWIRSLMASFIKGWEGSGVKIGGLYGAPVGTNRLALPWTRAQQAAFLIRLWEGFARTVADREPTWALASSGRHSMFAQNSLVNTDQGVRAFLQVANDILFVLASELDLFGWRPDLPTNETLELEDVTAALKSLRGEAFLETVHELSKSLVTFDWRTSSAPGLTDVERVQKSAFRGSGGYRELRRQLLRHVAASKGILARASGTVSSRLKLT